MPPTACHSLTAIDCTMDTLPRSVPKSNQAITQAWLQHIRASVGAIGSSGLIAFLMPPILLFGFGLFPIALQLFFLLTALGVALAIGSTLLFRLTLKKADRFYRSGSFNRIAAIRTMAVSHRLFMLSQALWWGGLTLLLAALILREFGAMIAVFFLAGGMLGVGASQFVSALKARPTFFRLICCRRGSVPVLGWSALVRYVLMPDERLAADRLDDPDGLASLLAVIAQGEGSSNGAALRIPSFGEWPGLSWLRETRLRLRASVPLFGLGCLSGVIAGGILLWGVGLDPIISGAISSKSPSETEAVVMDGASTDAASGPKTEPANKVGDAVAEAAQVEPQNQGRLSPIGSPQDSGKDMAGGQKQAASEPTGQPQVGSPLADEETAMAQDRAPSTLSSVPQEDAGQETGLAEQSDAAGSELAAPGGGRAQAEPQALSDTLAPFPPESRTMDRLEVDLVPGRATGAASSSEGTGRDQREGIASATVAAETSGSYGRGAKDARIEEIHAKATNRDTTMPTRPHIPVQQVPRWMKSLITPLSE